MTPNRIPLSVLVPSIVLVAVGAFIVRDLTVEHGHVLDNATQSVGNAARVMGERLNSSLIVAEFLVSEQAQDMLRDPSQVNAVVRLRKRQAYAPPIGRVAVIRGRDKLFAATAPAPGDTPIGACYDFDPARATQIHASRSEACPLAVSRAVPNGEGGFTWIVLAQMSRAFMDSLANLQREIAARSDIALIDEAQNIVLASSPASASAIQAITGQAGAGFEGRGQHIYTDAAHLVGLYQLPSYPLRMVVAVDRSSLLEAWWLRARTEMGFGGLFALMALAWGVVAYRWGRRRSALEARLRDEERQRLRAEEANNMKSQFLHHMSHELRTPLNVILGFSEIIRDRVLGNAPEKYAEYANDIHSSGSILLHIINDLLEIAKIESGRLTLERVPIDVGQVINEAAELMRAQVASAKLTVRIEGGHCMALGDHRAILQILLNLLSNAIKHTPPEGEITIRCRQDDRIHVDVQDTGSGMDEATLARVGRPFEQADNRLDLTQKGTGLGLAVCTGLLRLLDGTFNLTSTLGKGTTASFSLPAGTVQACCAPVAIASASSTLH